MVECCSSSQFTIVLLPRQLLLKGRKLKLNGLSLINYVLYFFVEDDAWVGILTINKCFSLNCVVLSSMTFIHITDKQKNTFCCYYCK